MVSPSPQASRSQPRSQDLIQLLAPVYNEGENVAHLYAKLEKESIEFDTLTFVYDFDEDSTLPFIERIAEDDTRVRADKNQFGRGVLNALRWGFSRCHAGPVIVVMADNSDKLELIPEMVRLWSQGFTVVNPSRYMRGGGHRSSERLKSFLSRAAGVSLNVLGFPISDATNNFKLYDGTWLRGQTIQSSGGFEVALELCYKAYRQDKRLVELPTESFDRVLGQSKFKMLSWTPRYLKWYLLCLAQILRRPFSRRARP